MHAFTNEDVCCGLSAQSWRCSKASKACRMSDVTKAAEVKAFVLQICFQRNVHQRDQDIISDLAALYEPTPNLYPQILVESLFDLPKQKKVGCCILKGSYMKILLELAECCCCPRHYMLHDISSRHEVMTTSAGQQEATKFGYIHTDIQTHQHRGYQDFASKTSLARA